MFSIHLRFSHLIGCIFLVFLSISCKCERNIEVIVNPSCERCGQPDPTQNNSTNNLIYVKATGTNDTIHMFFSTIDSFSLMIFKSDFDSYFTVDQDKLLSKNQSAMFESIKFNKAPIESFGYSFPSIYEVNDTQGVADLTKIAPSQTITHLTSNLVWGPFKELTNNSGQFEGYLDEHRNGSFKFLIRYYGKDQRDSELPRLLLNSESISIDFIIDNIQASYKDAKFGLNVVVLTSHQNCRMGVKKTLDDEYTPATFNLWHIENDDKNNMTHSYFQWRPIFYYASPKNVENSTITRQYSLISTEPNMTHLGMGSVFFDSNKVFSTMNISFGIEGDEKNGYFYPQSNYSIWTFSVGLGSAPIEKISPVVSLVIFVGFGLPALVILIGLVVMIVKKLMINSRRSEFQQL